MADGALKASEYIRKNTPSKTVTITTRHNRMTDPVANLFGQNPLLSRLVNNRILIHNNIGWTENSKVVFPTGHVLSGDKLTIHRVTKTDTAAYLILRIERTNELFDEDLTKYLPDTVYFKLSMSEMHDTYTADESNSKGCCKGGTEYKEGDCLGCDAIVLCEGTNMRLTFDDREWIRSDLLVELCSSTRYVEEVRKKGTKFLYPNVLPSDGCSFYIARVREHVVTRNNADETGYIVHFSGEVFGFVKCAKDKIPGLWNTVEVWINRRDLLVTVPKCVDLDKYKTDVMYKCGHKKEFDGGGVQYNDENDVGMMEEEGEETENNSVAEYTNEEKEVLRTKPIETWNDTLDRYSKMGIMGVLCKNLKKGKQNDYEGRKSGTIVNNEMTDGVTSRKSTIGKLYDVCTNDYDGKKEKQIIDSLDKYNTEIINKIQDVLSKGYTSDDGINFGDAVGNDKITLNVSVASLSSGCSSPPSPHVRFPKDKMIQFSKSEDIQNKAWIGILPIKCESTMTVRVWDKPWSALSKETKAGHTDRKVYELELLVIPAECVHQEIVEAGKQATYLIFVITVQKKKSGGRDERVPGNRLLFRTMDGTELTNVCG